VHHITERRKGEGEPFTDDELLQRRRRQGRRRWLYVVLKCMKA
jgi:hypothetical protein